MEFIKIKKLHLFISLMFLLGFFSYAVAAKKNANPAKEKSATTTQTQGKGDQESKDSDTGEKANVQDLIVSLESNKTINVQEDVATIKITIPYETLFYTQEDEQKK